MTNIVTVFTAGGSGFVDLVHQFLPFLLFSFFSDGCVLDVKRATTEKTKESERKMEGRRACELWDPFFFLRKNNEIVDYGHQPYHFLLNFLVFLIGENEVKKRKSGKNRKRPLFFWLRIWKQGKAEREIRCTFDSVLCLGYHSWIWFLIGSHRQRSWESEH